eukprot:GDKI01039594.1.p1 GENE.GDKI01039594.1~~GDKI01039594.1.p1  ORF type:complete len:524 (-),score=195.60 GDKI01039594.1:166-1686(-)
MDDHARAHARVYYPVVSAALSTPPTPIVAAPHTMSLTQETPSPAVLSKRLEDISQITKLLEGVMQTENTLKNINPHIPIPPTHTEPTARAETHVRAQEVTPMSQIDQTITADRAIEVLLKDVKHTSGGAVRKTDKNLRAVGKPSAEELAAVRRAIERLSVHPHLLHTTLSLIQTSATPATRLPTAADFPGGSQEDLTRFLKGEGSKYDTWRKQQEEKEKVENTRPTLFAGLKETLMKIKDTLAGEQLDDTTKLKTCTDQLDKAKAKLEYSTSEHAKIASEYTQEYRELQDAISDAVTYEKQLHAKKAAFDQAVHVRQEEKTNYDRQTRDRTLALKVVQSAKTVLEKYYALKDTSASTAEGTVRHTAQTAPVMQSLDYVSEKIKQEQVDADKEEKQDLADFDKLQTAFLKENDQLHNMFVDKTVFKAGQGTKVGHMKADTDAAQQLLEAAKASLSAVEGGCQPTMEGYEERQKKRKIEIDSLQDAWEILSGSTVGARTGVSVQTMKE